MKRIGLNLARFAVVMTILSGCALHHSVAFEDVHYNIGGKQQNANIIAVIDHDTLNKTVSIKSAMSGIGNSWDAQAGQMLKQVSDVELPQMFEHYELVSSYQKPILPGRHIVLNLTIPSYEFNKFHATILLHAIAYGSGNKVLFDKTYKGEGDTQGAKMYWAGPYAMKSAVRQSSLDAYKKIFLDMRIDLAKALQRLR